MGKLEEFWNWYIGPFSDTDNKVKLVAWSTTLVVKESSVLRINTCAEKSIHLKSAKR